MNNKIKSHEQRFQEEDCCRLRRVAGGFALLPVLRALGDGNPYGSDNSDILRTDSLITLLREKDENTLRLLR